MLALALEKQLMLLAFFPGTDLIHRQGHGATMLRELRLLLSTSCQSYLCRPSSPRVRDTWKH